MTTATLQSHPQLWYDFELLLFNFSLCIHSLIWSERPTEISEEESCAGWIRYVWLNWIWSFTVDCELRERAESSKNVMRKSSITLHKNITNTQSCLARYSTMMIMTLTKPPQYEWLISKTTYPCFPLLSESALDVKNWQRKLNSNFWCLPLLWFCIHMTLTLRVKSTDEWEMCLLFTGSARSRFYIISNVTISFYWLIVIRTWCVVKWSGILCRCHLYLRHLALLHGTNLLCFYHVFKFSWW